MLGKFLSFAAALAGCSAPASTARAGLAALPETWQSRHPYLAGDAAILAHDDSEAEEAGRLIGEVAADFRRRTGRTPSPRLLVIVGNRGWLGDADPCLELRVGVLGDAILDGRPEPSAAELERRCEELRDAAARVGLEPRTLLALKPDALASDAFVKQLGLPASSEAAFDWAIVISTEEELVRAVRAMVDAAIEKEELNPTQRTLLAPLLPWMRGRAVDAARGTIKSVLFAVHASAQADWSREERRREVDAYAKAIGAERGGAGGPGPRSERLVPGRERRHYADRIDEADAAPHGRRIGRSGSEEEP
jgi:hypothetical protein